MKCQIEMRPFLRHRGLGVFCECLGYWFQEHVAIPRDAWQLAQQKTCTDVLESSGRMPSKDENKKISQYQRWLTVQKPIQPIHLLYIRRHIVLVRQLPLRFPATSFKSRWPRFLKNLRIKKILFDIIMGFCMPKTLLWSKAILFGWSTWLSKCVRALHFPLLGFEAGLERETAWNNWDIFYEDLLQVTFDIRTGNTKDGWKKHGINRQPFFELEHRVTRLNCRWPRFPKNLRIKKILFDIIMGSACRRHCYGPRLFLLGGAHD